MLVEDELGVRTLAEAVLTHAGYTVLCAAAPDDALKIVQEHQGSIDLMLSDVVMPGMNGPDLARRVIELRPSTKVILMSGYPGEPLRRDGTLDDETTYLEKPFTPRALAEKVGKALAS